MDANTDVIINLQQTPPINPPINPPQTLTQNPLQTLTQTPLTQNSSVDSKDKIKDLKTTNKQSESANSHKEISQNLLNINVAQTQIGILVNVYWLGCESGMCKTIISLIIISLIFQGLIFMLVTWLFYVDSSYKYKFLSSEMVNGIVTLLSGISLVINCSITAVGLKIPGINATKSIL